MFALPVAEHVRARQSWVLSVLRAMGLWSGRVDKPSPASGTAVTVATSPVGYRDVTAELYRAEEQVIPARYAALMGHDSYKRGPGGALRQVRRG